jgi:ATP-dependent Zn protease
MKFLPIILIFIIFSCSVEKRYHRSGWNFQRQSIHTPWKIKKSGQIPHELSENNSAPNEELDTTSSEKIDAIHLSKIDLTVNEKDTKNLAVETVTSDTLTHLIAHKKKKSALAQMFLRKEIENPQIFKKNNYRDAMANWQKPTYFEGSSSLWSAFIVVGIIGLIMLLIAALLQSALLVIIS